MIVFPPKLYRTQCKNTEINLIKFMISIISFIIELNNISISKNTHKQMENTIISRQESTSCAKYSLVDNTKEGTIKRLISNYFEEHIGKPLRKRDIELEFAIRWAVKDVKFPTLIKNDDDLLRHIKEAHGYIPGDVQKSLRDYYKQFKECGLSNFKKNKELFYVWNPCSKNEVTVPSCPRNLFKNKEQIISFRDSKNNKCELCGVSALRMAIDHWRAFSIYYIDNTKIAVLLCERCNNIHHNHDAVKVAKKYSNNLSVVKNWISIESRIQKLGYLPNEKDKEQQLCTINYIKTEFEKKELYCKENFWKGLDK